MPRGGPRPGAGAPRGNLNALKHGNASRQLKQVSDILAVLPRPTQTPANRNPRVSKRRKGARMLAAHLLLSVLERAPSGSKYRNGPEVHRLRELLNAAPLAGPVNNSPPESLNNQSRA